MEKKIIVAEAEEKSLEEALLDYLSGAEPEVEELFEERLSLPSYTYGLTY